MDNTGQTKPSPSTVKEKFAFLLVFLIDNNNIFNEE